jgi:hypothetical protein
MIVGSINEINGKGIMDKIKKEDKGTKVYS